jgi:Concanavalin A-like lectin/glucanases superfamily
MKAKLIGSCVLLVIALSLLLPRLNGLEFAAQARACLPPPAGLTNWWPGDGNTEDIAGGLDAALHDDATFRAGLVAQAFALDGDGDFVSIPHDPALDLGTGDFTVDLWVNFKETSGEQILIEKWIQRFAGASEGWTLTKLEGNVLVLAMSASDGSETGVNSDVLPIPSRTWVHFAATRKSGLVTLYMNGSPVAAGEVPINLDSDSSLKFGHRGNPDDTPGSEDERGFYLNGRIDEVELFIGRALSPRLIRAIYRAGSAGKCKD